VNEVRALRQKYDDPNAFASVVGASVRRERQKRDWTQAQLAEAADLSTNFVARLERGELGISLFVAYQLAGAFEIDIEALVATPKRGGRRKQLAATKTG
jgi:transcriptional regulator with XRE-family HTH domain